MPDNSGTNANHDVRYATKVDTTTPTIPPPFTGMLWYDSDAPAFPTHLYTIQISVGPYAVQDADECIVITAGTFNVTLPAATGSGRVLWIKNLGVGNNITVLPNGVDTLDGEPNQGLIQYDCLNIVDYAANKWAVI